MEYIELFKHTCNNIAEKDTDSKLMQWHIVCLNKPGNYLVFLTYEYDISPKVSQKR